MSRVILLTHTALVVKIIFFGRKKIKYLSVFFVTGFYIVYIFVKHTSSSFRLKRPSLKFVLICLSKKIQFALFTVIIIYYFYFNEPY